MRQNKVEFKFSKKYFVALWCIHIHDTILQPLDNEIETEQNLKRTLCNGMMDCYPQDKKRKAALKGGERDASGPKKRENKKKKTENSKNFYATSLCVCFCFG